MGAAVSRSVRRDAARRRSRDGARGRGWTPGLPRRGVRRRGRPVRAVVRERPADATSLTAAVSRLVGGQRSCRPSFAVAFEHRLPHPRRARRASPCSRCRCRSRPAIGVRFTGARASRCRADAKPGSQPAARSAASKEARPFPGGKLRHPDPVLAGEHAAVVRLHVADDGQAAAVPNAVQRAVEHRQPPLARESLGDVRLGVTHQVLELLTRRLRHRTCQPRTAPSASRRGGRQPDGRPLVKRWRAPSSPGRSGPVRPHRRAPPPPPSFPPDPGSESAYRSPRSSRAKVPRSVSLLGRIAVHRLTVPSDYSSVLATRKPRRSPRQRVGDAPGPSGVTGRAISTTEPTNHYYHDLSPLPSFLLALPSGDTEPLQPACCYASARLTGHLGVSKDLRPVSTWTRPVMPRCSASTRRPPFKPSTGGTAATPPAARTPTSRTQAGRDGLPAGPGPGRPAPPPSAGQPVVAPVLDGQARNAAQRLVERRLPSTE